MRASVHRFPQASVTCGNLHHPHGEGHRRFILTGDMDQITAKNPVGIQAQIVVGLPLNRCPRYRTNA